MDAGGTGVGIGAVKVFSTKRACPQCGTSYPELDPRMFSYNSKHGWCTGCVGTGLALTREQRKAYDDERARRRQQGPRAELPGRGGRGRRPGRRTLPRLRWRAAEPGLARRDLRGQGHQRHRAPVGARGAAWIDALRWKAATPTSRATWSVEIRSRLEFLEEVGLGYLTLDRAAPTLSGGEAQRIRLAAQLGSNLQGVCYVLDEPTIGLHPRDNGILLGRWPSWATRATRWWWSSTTRTPSAAPTT
jgi:excinuclease ABC subunit A